MTPTLTGPTGQLRWMSWRNDASETAPPGGVIRVTGAALVAGQAIVTGSKPSTTFQRSYAINGRHAVSAGKFGLCTFDSPAVVLYDESATPSLGEGWGPQADSWALKKQYPTLATMLGVVSGANRQVLATLEPINTVIGKLAGSLSQGSSATVNIYNGAGTIISSLTLSGSDWLMKSGATAIASGKKVVCQWICGTWWITEAECA